MWQFGVYRRGEGHADGVQDERFLNRLPLQQDGHIAEGVYGEHADKTWREQSNEN